MEVWMTAQDIRRMLELLASIDARLNRIETMAVAILAEAFEMPEYEVVEWTKPKPPQKDQP
jgi:hypothetical protein